ncbi:hypothetical protein EJ05DRAFT_300905 [Pseudovirgaria hyperparasitica]|uniref:Uncharacterized protein n=1 Tax=Pseudovirgaria hyperparasitica TaxID=470096 RepID=A0A6A6W9H5_9PEZI|nr:uncharacterized protein EJ05DRAFT_300905 [Pseudovirgaria hyperparasitica]KAF2759512.1 hypothetical protein EJ05DRAFT_300905 [Pseudovirgaria hyperparasitica]
MVTDKTPCEKSARPPLRWYICRCVCVCMYRHLPYIIISYDTMPGLPFRLSSKGRNGKDGEGGEEVHFC